MILQHYRVDASSIPGAGKGLFVDDVVAAGSIIVAPDDIHLHLSGVKVTYDPARPAGQPITPLTLPDRPPSNARQAYRLSSPHLRLSLAARLPPLPVAEPRLGAPSWGSPE